MDKVQTEAYLSVFTRASLWWHVQVAKVDSITPAIDVHSIISNALSVYCPFFI